MKAASFAPAESFPVKGTLEKSDSFGCGRPAKRPHRVCCPFVAGVWGPARVQMEDRPGPAPSSSAGLLTKKNMAISAAQAVCGVVTEGILASDQDERRGTMHKRENEMSTHPRTGVLVRDFVCGREVDATQTEWRHVHEGETYYFCHPRCLGKFRLIPRLYLRAALASRAELPMAFRL
jgi:YHS domain-containing protein